MRSRAIADDIADEGRGVAGRIAQARLGAWQTACIAQPPAGPAIGAAAEQR